MNLRLHHSFVAASLSFLLLSASHAATCPFDNGGSDALNDGLVLTRYALGITGAPLIASTRYASLDPLQVKNNIECVGCALDMNGDGQIDAVDTTIIARHLAGFTGASLTAGLALGSAPSASRTDTASITSFLVNGCAVGSSLPPGTLDQTLRYSAANTLTATDDFRVLADGGIVATNAAINAVFAASGTPTGTIPATGPGARMTWYPAKAAFRAGYVPGTQWDDANVGQYSTATGQRTTASGSNSTAMGRGTTASAFASTAMGANSIATGDFSTAMGAFTTAFGRYSTAMGSQTTANGDYSTVMGASAIAADTCVGCFVYGDNSSTVTLTAPRQFVALATGGTAFYSSSVGAQNTWHGVILPPGAGAWSTLSDRASKDDFAAVNTRELLERVVALPMSTWRYKHQAENVRHMGPIAQDFFEAFQLGEDERRISTVDADGVAFAAIQGLNAKLGDALKIKDQEIAALRDELTAQKQALSELTDLKEQFVALKRDVQAAVVPTVALRQ